MQVTIDPALINGTVAAPASKSYTQRVLAAALLHKGTTVIRNAGDSADEQAAKEIIQQLGAKVSFTAPGKIQVISAGVAPVSGHIHCGESGLAARLFTPIAALSSAAVTIEGAGSLLQRPMAGFNEVLPALGVTVTGFNGRLPVTVQGPLTPVSVSINGADGSQFLSGLLFAICAAATTRVAVGVAELKSKPYIDLTLEVLGHFGWPVVHHDYKEFSIDPSLFTSRDTVEIDAEGDWSSAAYLLVAGAIAGNIEVANLNINSKQADRAIIDVLRDCGASITVGADNISVAKSRMRAFEFDATDRPDLFPVLSILAACCDGESYIRGVHRLFHKESDRAQSISEMLENFAFPFSMEDDCLCITGVRKLQGTVIDGYNDHRIVMAAAIGALRANGPVDITCADAVKKSYPAFFTDLISCGAKCTFNQE